MKKLNNLIPKYIVFSFPLVAALLVWEVFQNQSEVWSYNNIFLRIVWEFLSWHLMLWFLILIYFIFLLVISPGTRYTFLTRLAGIRERDERENYIIGKASRFTFFATLAFLIFLLFFTTVSIDLKKLPAEKAVNGKQNQLSINASFKLFENRPAGNEPGPGEKMYSTESFSFSKQFVLLLVIIWHLGTFKYYSRKMLISG